MNNKTHQLNHAVVSGKNMASVGSKGDRIVYRNQALGKSMNNSNFLQRQGGSIS